MKILADDVGLDCSRIDFSGPDEIIAMRVIQEARAQNRMSDLRNILVARYPSRRDEILSAQ